MIAKAPRRLKTSLRACGKNERRCKVRGRMTRLNVVVVARLSGTCVRLWRVVFVGLFLGLVDARAADPSVQVWTAVEYGRTAEGPLLLDLYLPAGSGPFPWLIRFSSSRERPDETARTLLQAGYALAFASYDIEDNGRVFPPWPAVPRAVRRGLVFLKANAADLGLDPARAGVWGWSRGAYAAALAANLEGLEAFDDGAFPRVDAGVRLCVTLAGSFGFVPEEMQGLDLQLQPRPGHGREEEAAFVRWIGPDMAPTLSFRGERDGSFADVEALHEALRTLGVPAELHRVPDAGHRVGGERVSELILGWLERHLVAEPPVRAPGDALARMLQAGVFEAARRHYPGQRRRIEETETAALRASLVAQWHRPVPFWREAAKRWRELDGGKDPAFAAQLQARQEAAAREAEAWTRAQARKRRTVAPWPDGVAVPAWAAAHGADGFGPWATLRLPGAPELDLRFRPLKGGGWLGETEVSQAQYERVTGLNPSYFRAHPEHPVEGVAHADALAFCRRIGELIPGVTVRLPYYAEWLSAAEAEASLDATAWFVHNSGGSTQPVGTRAANAHGFHDLAGNVFEWLADPRTEPPLHYRPYVGGCFASRPERCDPTWITAHNGANSTFYHGLRILVEP